MSNQIKYNAKMNDSYLINTEQNEFASIDLNQSGHSVDGNNNNNNNQGLGKKQSSLDYTSLNQTDNLHKITTKSLNALDIVKNWSKTTFKCTKQMITERLGKTTRTIDADLEAHIEQLRDTKRSLEQILNISRTMTNHFYLFINAQKKMSDVLIDLSHKDLELAGDYATNAEVQKSLFKNGEALISALQCFESNLNTLCHKTIEDTIITIRNYETARLEFDAYRCDLELIQQQKGSPARGVFDDAQKQFDLHKEKYEKLKEDVVVKMKFLNENRVQVMQKQLTMYHDAICAYFSGNKTALENIMKQYSIKQLKTTESLTLSPLKSFLEDN